MRRDFDPWPDCPVHVEWGTAGAGLAAARGDIVVVVDVLSFSTTLDIAVSRDFTCLVYSPEEVRRMGGLDAAGSLLGARPVSKRRQARPGELSLSPASLLSAEPGQRALFTSLNGAAVTAAAEGAPALLAGCLRNATAVADAVSGMLAEAVARRVTVVACAEQWPRECPGRSAAAVPGTHGIRPSLEDWIGAGLISARLEQRGLTLSAEARVAAGAALSCGPQALADCVSARELRARGFADDVALALEADVSDRVPARSGGGGNRRTFTAR